VADDTAAINNAISSGGRCGPGTCQSSTTSPAVVYFPTGNYLISASLIDYYETQLIGNPNCVPVLRATANFSGFGLVDGDQYGANGLGFGSTNVFYRQIRNFVLDMTNIPSTSAITGIHWPTAQATSLQNIVFQMSDVPGTQHNGIFIESGAYDLIILIGWPNFCLHIYRLCSELDLTFSPRGKMLEIIADHCSIRFMMTL
jgi:glucan 1,3-beta-glucosidase